MTQLEFTTFAQSKVNDFVGRNIYGVTKLCEVEAYVWGMIDMYSATIPYLPTFDRNQLEADILSYVVIEEILDDDNNVYPHGTILTKMNSN